MPAQSKPFLPLTYLQHREVATPAWDLAADAVQRLTTLLKPGQDEISQVGRWIVLAGAGTHLACRCRGATVVGH